MSRYLINEPHPTVSQNAYTHAGRGGAGNFFRAPETTPASGVATAFKPSKPSKKTASFYSGRGGAGNAHTSASRPQMSFDEEYSAAAARETGRSGFYVGRGGAGNHCDAKSSSIVKSVERRDSDSTTSSTKSSRSGFWGRLSLSRD